MGITSVAVERSTEPTARQCVDITEARTDRVESYAERAAGPVHLERRGGRTFLVVETDAGGART
jgi:hypothetical protein